MNLKELKDRVDFLIKAYHGAEDYEVVITLNNSSVGGRAKTGIRGVYSGIDWEMHQIRIEPEDKIVREI